MLEDLLKRAVRMGADRIEIECEDGSRLFSACCGPTDIGIARLDRPQWDAVYEQMKDMKKKRSIVLGGASYRPAFSKYDSFGEWVFVIQVKEVE